MEDFVVLSILDLQIDATKHKQVDKREIICYIMLGDKCIDCLVLGSPNLSLQKSVQDSGGAADLQHPAFDQRGSTSFEEPA